jgi:N-acetylneuraminic acid mutarotase
MSKNGGRCHSLAHGLYIALVCALAALAMTRTALAQDRGSWSAASTMPTGTGDSGVTALDGKVYVIGGASFYPHFLPSSSDMGTGTWGSSINYEYDPATDTWSQRAPMPIGLSHVGVVGFKHKLYVFGGFTSNVHKNAQNEAVEYDPAANTWRWLAPLSSRRGSVSAAEVGGKIHVFGGRPRDPTPVNDHDIYDPATNQWTKGPPMPMARDHMGIAVIDGKIHIVGGRTGASTQNVHEHDVYDPTTGQWTKAAPMPTARSGGAAVYYHGLLLYVGGECEHHDPHAGFGGGDDFDENEGYDPKTNTWRSLTKLRSARQAFGAAAVGSAAYFPGGTLRCGGLALTDQMSVFRLK